MIFHTKQRKLANDEIPNIEINAIPIERISHFKFLGTFIDTNLTWSYYLNYVANKLSRICKIIARLKHHIPLHILKIIYNSLSVSHLSYGITAWGFNIGPRIRKLQKRAIRNLTNSKYNAHTIPLFRTHNLLMVDDIFKLSCFNFFYKYENKMVPFYFNNMFIKNENTIPRLRRSRQIPQRFNNTENNLQNNNNYDIQVKHSNFKFCRLCIRHEIPKLIQNTYFPNIVLSKINSHSYKGFINYAKNYIITNYDRVCTIPNCYICRNGL